MTDSSSTESESNTQTRTGVLTPAIRQRPSNPLVGGAHTRKCGAQMQHTPLPGFSSLRPPPPPWPPARAHPRSSPLRRPSAGVAPSAPTSLPSPPTASSRRPRRRLAKSTPTAPPRRWSTRAAWCPSSAGMCRRARSTGGACSCSWEGPAPAPCARTSTRPPSRPATPPPPSRARRPPRAPRGRATRSM